MKTELGKWELSKERVVACDDNDNDFSYTVFTVYDGNGNIVATEEYGASRRNVRLVALLPDMLTELGNILRQAQANPFLSVGMLIEHHSKLNELKAKINEVLK